MSDPLGTLPGMIDVGLRGGVGADLRGLARALSGGCASSKRICSRCCDHVDGFARVPRHDPDRMRLLCGPHNQYAARLMYGTAFTESARAARPVDNCQV